jgi:hypothetical protein
MVHQVRDSVAEKSGKKQSGEQEKSESDRNEERKKATDSLFYKFTVKRNAQERRSPILAGFVALLYNDCPNPRICKGTQVHSRHVVHHRRNPAKKGHKSELSGSKGLFYLLSTSPCLYMPNSSSLAPDGCT